MAAVDALQPGALLVLVPLSDCVQSSFPFRVGIGNSILLVEDVSASRDLVLVVKISGFGGLAWLGSVGRFYEVEDVLLDLPASLLDGLDDAFRVYNP